MQNLQVYVSYLFLFLAEKAELQVNVVELPHEFSTGTLDNNCPPLQPHLDCEDTEKHFQALGPMHSQRNELIPAYECSQ